MLSAISVQTRDLAGHTIVFEINMIDQRQFR